MLRWVIWMDLKTADEIADVLRLSRTTIYRLTAKGVIPVYKVGRNNRYDLNQVMDCLKREGGEFEPHTHRQLTSFNFLSGPPDPPSHNNMIDKCISAAKRIRYLARAIYQEIVWGVK